MFCMKAVAVVHCEALTARKLDIAFAGIGIQPRRLGRHSQGGGSHRLRGPSRLCRAARVHRSCDARPTLNVVVVEIRGRRGLPKRKRKSRARRMKEHGRHWHGSD